MAFYGDCIVAFWPPGYCGPQNAQKALKAARTLRSPMPGGLAAGVAVNHGPVYISTVQATKGLIRDVSIFGVEVNKTARLAALAAPGQALAIAAVLAAAGEDAGGAVGINGGTRYKAGALAQRRQGRAPL